MVLPILFLIFVFVLLLWQASLIVAVVGGAPTVYPKEKVIRRAYDSVKLKKDQLVADLGCGNTRSLIIAAKQYKAKGIGIEISPFYYLAAKANVFLASESKNIKILFGNFRKRERGFKDADVIYLYFFDRITDKIEPFGFL
jgi:cyclopropane fatty-acyl-phospholipid synthase-like methyltransferase